MKEEERRSRKVWKPGSPKVSQKPEVGSQKSEEENNSALDIQHSEINNTHPKSEINPK